MAFLQGLNGKATTATSGAPVSSRFLGGLKKQTPQEQKVSALKANEEKLKAEAARANSPLEIAKRTAMGIPKVLQDAGKFVMDPITKALATPVIRATQAGVALYGKATRNGDLVQKAYKPLALPSALGGEPTTIEPQKAFGQGGGKQVVGDALQYGATVYPGSAAERVVGKAFLGTVKKAAAEGATVGAISGAGFMGGEALSDNLSPEEIAKQALIGGGAGVVLGGALGAGGAKLLGDRALRPLSVEDLNPKYRYHETAPDNVPSIARNGLHPSEGQYGKGVYFTPEAGRNEVSGEGIILRVDKSKLPPDYDEFPEQGWTKNNVPPESLQVSKDGGRTWTDLATGRPAEGPVDIKRFYKLPVEDANVRPAAVRSNTRQVTITRVPEPYVPESELPVIKYGPPAPRSTEPSIDLDAFAPIRPDSTEIGITSFRGKPVNSVADTETYYNTTRAKGFINSLENTSANHNVQLGKVDKTAGSWEGSIEPSFSVKVSGTLEDIRAYAAANSKKANQDAVILFTPGEGKSVKYTFKGVKDPDAFLKKLHSKGISGATVNGKNVLIYDIDGSLAANVAKVSKATKTLPDKVLGKGELIFKNDYDKYIKPGKRAGTGDRGSVRTQVRAEKSADTGPELTFEPIKEPQVKAEVPKPSRTETSPATRTNAPKSPKPSPRVNITTSPGRSVTMDIPRRTASVAVNAPKDGKAVTVSKPAREANRKLVEDGYDAVPEAELARISSINKADQIDRVTRLMDDPRVKDMAAGTVPVPDGVAPQVLFNAVRNRAVAENDFETLRRLATSRIAGERATAAQTLGSAGFNNEPADAVRAIREVSDERAKAAVRRRQPSSVEKEARAAKTSIKKVQARETWDSVVDALTC